MSTRIITAFTTVGQNKTKVETDVTTWGELKVLLSNEGLKLDGLAATESINRNDLAHDQAVLPEGDFIIFLRPVKTKSGSDLSGKSWKELRAMITTVEMKEFLNNYIAGKSWTQLKTEELVSGITAYNNQNGTSSITDATTQDSGDGVLCEGTNANRASQVNNLLLEIKSNTNDEEVIERVDLILEEVKGLITAISESASAEEAEQAENKRLADEFRKLQSGFNDSCTKR